MSDPANDTRPEPDRRRWWALVGFVGHVPGLWIMKGPKVGPTTTRLNLVILAATIVATVASGAWTSTTIAIAAFAVGHFAWSTLLATRLLTDVAGD